MKNTDKPSPEFALHENSPDKDQIAVLSVMALIAEKAFKAIATISAC